MAEDEFKGRDAQGLQPRKKDGPKDDDAAFAAAQSKYMKMFFVFMPLLGQALGWGTYLLAAHAFGQQALMEAKFALLAEWDLGWLFLAVFAVRVFRQRLDVNCNASRAAARLDRPDQHIYKVMDPGGKPGAPYVLMANTGRAGQFNRAQRGAFNTDEALPKFIVDTVLAGLVFGPVVLALACLSGYGRVQFALGYTQHQNDRRGGMLPAFLAEGLMANLVLVIGLKATPIGQFIPF